MGAAAREGGGLLSLCFSAHSLTIESTKTEARDRGYQLCGAPT